MTDSIFKQMGSVISSAIESEETARNTALSSKQDTLVSGTNLKTINGESLLGSGDIVTDNTEYFLIPESSGEIFLGNYFLDVSWFNTNTSTYGWLVQRKDGVSTGVAQFGLVQGGYRAVTNGGSVATILPFQINALNELIVGTPTRLWNNSSYYTGFSTCSIVTDNKSGAFHYSGNIPFPGNSSYIMGYGTAILNANNTATHIYQSGTDTSLGIHEHNGQYFGLSDSDGSGWLGANTGYRSSDSKTMIHGLDFRNPSSPSISVYSPGSDTSTSPVMQLILQENSTTSNTAISGCTHWRQAGPTINARVFAGNSPSYNDLSSGSGDWNTYLSASPFFGVALSTGKVLVYHGAKTYLYTAYNSRIDVTTQAGVAPLFYSFVGSVDFGGACIIPDGIDSWLIINSSAQLINISKWTINPTTYEWTKNWLSPILFTGMQTGGYLKLNKLPNDRIMVSYRATNGFFYYWIINRASLPA